MEGYMLMMMTMSRVAMTSNSSSLNSSSLNSSSNSSSNPSYTPMELCLRDRSIGTITVSYNVFGLLVLLPIFILVLHMGHRRWRKQRSTGHSDFLTYHMVCIEIISLVGFTLYSCGVFTCKWGVLMAGVYLFSSTTSGQTLFHVLICMDRFLAVVYPVAYMSLKQEGGVRIRNVCTVCAWVCCLIGIGAVKEIMAKSSSVMAFGFWVFSSVFIIIFSLSVLCVLIHPGPGDGKRVDHSKRRAFNSIMAILCALMLRSMGYMTACGVFSLSALEPKVKCAVIMLFTWFSVPSSLVLPLMFLHRVGKLRLCKPSIRQGNKHTTP